jgi:hypothetical protein
MHHARRSVSLMHRDVPAPDKSIRSHMDVIQVVVLFSSGTRSAVLALKCFRRDAERADVRHKSVWRPTYAESAVDAHVDWDPWGCDVRVCGWGVFEGDVWAGDGGADGGASEAGAGKGHTAVGGLYEGREC